MFIKVSQYDIVYYFNFLFTNMDIYEELNLSYSIN